MVNGARQILLDNRHCWNLWLISRRPLLPCLSICFQEGSNWELRSMRQKQNLEGHSNSWQLGRPSCRQEHWILLYPGLPFTTWTSVYFLCIPSLPHLWDSVTNCWGKLPFSSPTSVSFLCLFIPCIPDSRKWYTVIPYLSFGVDSPVGVSSN